MAATYEPIATTTANGSSGVVTFTSIPQTYTDLVLVISAREETSTDGNIFVNFNNDTGGNYSLTQIYGDGSTASSARNSNQTKTGIFSAVTSGAGANIFGAAVAHIMNYSNSTTYKTMLSRGNANTNTNARVHLWRSTSAITEIDLSTVSGDWESGSTFTLYGIKAA